MRITIGEIVNEIIPFSKSIELKVHDNIPYVKAKIGSPSGFTLIYLYIAQIKEGLYTVYETNDEIFGRYLPTGDLKKPFIKDNDFINSWINNKIPNQSDQAIKNNIMINNFRKYFYELLYKLNLIILSPEILTTNLLAINYSKKIKNIIKIVYHEYNLCNFTIINFINYIRNYPGKLKLYGMSKNELQELNNVFHKIGLKLIITNFCITNILIIETNEQYYYINGGL
jgi:hypothetical protein